MGIALAVLTAIFMIGLVARNGPPAGSAPRVFHRGHDETIRFVDGPLAGSTSQQRTGRSGLPALQITPRVTRRDDLGGGYTLPYERGLLCDHCHHWHYSEGWTHRDLATADITTWGKAA